MKATGIVRRIDDLGRVVIPKEIRRTLRIREGAPLEIFTDSEGEVILKKYSPIGELGEFASEYTESLHEAIGHIVCVTDRDSVIAVSGAPTKEYLGKKISSDMEKVMRDKENVVYNEDTAGNYCRIYQDEQENKKYSSQVIVPITSQGDTIGSFIIASKEAGVKMGETEIKLAQTAAGFLGRQMEQ